MNIQPLLNTSENLRRANIHTPLEATAHAPNRIERTNRAAAQEALFGAELMFAPLIRYKT
jgi:hypothetical protein